ncbi:MAG: hypothetical protein ACYDA8_23810 [Deferrisomatales bacterium]
MTEPEEPPAVDRPRPRRRLGWWAAGLVLVAFAVVAGTYAILARADRAERKTSRGRE